MIRTGKIRSGLTVVKWVILLFIRVGMMEFDQQAMKLCPTGRTYNTADRSND